MLSRPELYQPDVDTLVREDGYVYIEDLALSGVILALKRGGTSPLDKMGLGGFLRVLDLSRTNLDELHTELSETIVGTDKWWRKRETRHELPHYPDIKVYKNYDRRLCVEVGTLDFRPVATTFTAGEKLDAAMLTGFLAFHGSGYDYANDREGLAQRVIDAHRQEAALFDRIAA